MQRIRMQRIRMQKILRWLRSRSNMGHWLECTETTLMTATSTGEFY